jgi:hypothetical protein
MGQLAQLISTQFRPVRRVRSAWRLVPVALGTAAVLGGCGAGGQHAPGVAASSAHANPAVSSADANPAVSSADAHPAVSAADAHPAVSSAHAHPAVSQAAATAQTGPGAHVTIRRSSAKRSSADVQGATPRPGARVKIITGTHNATIGTLAEGRSVVLVWTAAEAPIQIFTSRGNLLLNSHARHGSIRLAEGRYHGLHVSSPGAWTLRLHAAA